MWLFTAIVAVLCVVGYVNLAEISVKGPTSTATIDGNPKSSNDDSKDDYLPSFNWSDKFDWQLFKAVSANHRGNVLISPISIKLALLMLYEGSAGITEKQFEAVLEVYKKSTVHEHYKYILEALQDKRKDYILNIGTRLFLDSSIHPNQQFTAIVKNFYDTDIQPINFTNPIEAANIINSWVEILTNGRIQQITNSDDIHDDVLLTIANAVYFKGLWRTEFPKNGTHEGGFYISPTEVVKVPYISNTDKYFYVESKELDSKILRIPYKGKHFGLFLILPNSKGGLPELIRNINLASIKRQLYILDQRNVDVVIPKFKFEFSSSYSKILNSFGLNAMFSNIASFPGIARGIGSGTKWLFVNDIKQKAGIEINEKGSTVFAATEIELGNKFGQVEASFNATHPFLFFIEDETTGTILFSGKVVNPLQTEEIELPTRFGGGDTQNSVVHQTSGQNSNAQPSLNPVPPTEESAISSRFNYFDMELLESFDDTKNYFISPVSIKATLGMILEGAKGRCAEEIGRVLRIPIDQSTSRNRLRTLLYDLNSKSGTTVIESANGAFISDAYQFVPEYQMNLVKYYKAVVKSINFANVEASITQINNWVKDSTRGLITDILTPENFNSDATLVLINALYFFGQWKNEFEENSTSIKCFYHKRGVCTNAKTMQTIDNFNYQYISNLDAEAIQLPYGDGQYAMLVLLPSKEQSVDGLIRDVKFTSFSSIVDKLEPTEVLVKLPKFEIDYTADIVSDLQRLGIQEIFGPNANLSGIVINGQIKVNNILHRAKIEVNEKGTTAAAATGVVIIPLIGSSTPHFIADRPFLFFIYHVPSNNVLFSGRFNKANDVYDEIFSKDPVPPQVPIMSQTISSSNKQDAVSLSVDGQIVTQTKPLFFPADTVL